ncbi:MAG TPA: dTDP-4-dehydrorhamnose 3,5-epimerase family protein, partial [Mobilitalea sp.]|nr:dTDP-4-dehydrorhamnose 3,5-epimerase family protein [Mobilitalea sp.]
MEVNMIKVTHLELKEVLVLEYDMKIDNRGPSYKLFSEIELEEAGIHTKFIEEILYCPEKKGTLYGIHSQ